MIISSFSKKIKTKITKKYRKKIGRAILALFIFSLILPILPASARTFNPNDIITDSELTDKNSLSKAAIQKFLERENSVLSQYTQTVDGVDKKASEIIWEIGQKYSISPKFLLTNLEKEQGLINKSTATEKALNWATGYSCFGGSCNEKYKGFYNQVDAAAATQEIYLRKASQFSFKVGQTTKTFDGYNVTPANQATANLYIYTPYVGNAPELGINFQFGANKLFWRIWHRFFSEQKFLDGQIITYNGQYWLIKNNKKYKFTSKELFLNDYKENDAISASNEAVSAYPDGPEIYFSNNSIVKEAASGQIYLISDGFKRPIIDSSALALLTDLRIASIAPEQIKEVPANQLLSYDNGVNIYGSSIYPQGKLFQDEKGQIWQVKDNAKREVDQIVWQKVFNSQNPEPITSSELEKYIKGSPIKLKDGTFVENNGSYYLISEGKRMKIQDVEIFNRTFGVDKKNSAARISTALLEIHSAGEIIDYIDETVLDSESTAQTNNANTSYQASFELINPKQLVIMSGSKQTIVVQFKNTGNVSWQKGNVWLQMADKEKESSSFSVLEKINLDQDNISSGQSATFTFDITAPTNQTGLLLQDFSLYHNSNGQPTKITSAGKAIVVKNGISAEIIEHNIPLAVKNTWKPISITMKIKNTSADITWLAKKTALEIYNQDGSTSYFYDANDWVREKVAAVPVGKTYIKPGEIGEFKFTLDPRNIKRNTYIMKFKLVLLDKGKEVYLNGLLEWPRQIRVD